MRLARNIIILLILCGWTAIAQPSDDWKAILTTDTDIVFSIRLSEEVREDVNFAEVPLRISHPDGQVENYRVKLWRSGLGAFQKTDSPNPMPAPKTLKSESPMGLIHKRVFYPKEFEEWDESLEDLGPRHEDLLEERPLEQPNP